MNKAAFLDRDGVINRKAPEDEYVTRWEEMDFLPGVVEAIRLLNRGRFPRDRREQSALCRKGSDHDESNWIPCISGCVASWEPWARISMEFITVRTKNSRHAVAVSLSQVCCSRPRDEHHVDLTSSWMIGDSEKDVEAGRSAGCRTAQILRQALVADGKADVVARSLLEAVHQILRLEEAVRSLANRRVSE